MKEFSLNQKLTCLYCDEDMNCLAKDCICTVANLFGYSQNSYQHRVEEEICGHCDQTFYLKLSAYDDKVYVANLPEKIYQFEDALFDKKIKDFMLQLGLTPPSYYIYPNWRETQIIPKDPLFTQEFEQLVQEHEFEKIFFENPDKRQYWLKDFYSGCMVVEHHNDHQMRIRLYAEKPYFFKNSHKH